MELNSKGMVYKKYTFYAVPLMSFHGGEIFIVFTAAVFAEFFPFGGTVCQNKQA